MSLDEEDTLAAVSYCKHTSPIGVNGVGSTMRFIRKVHNAIGVEHMMEFYYTEDHFTHLRYLIDNAIPTTMAQEDIYIILLEEMEPYLQGQKDIDSCCKVLQSRVEIYLAESN